MLELAVVLRCLIKLLKRSLYIIKYLSTTANSNILKVNYRLACTIRQAHSYTLTHICMQLVLSLLLIRIMIRCVIGRVDGHMRRVHTIWVVVGDGSASAGK